MEGFNYLVNILNKFMCVEFEHVFQFIQYADWVHLCILQLHSSVMDLDVVLESENHFQAEPQRKTVHQPPSSRAKVDEKDIRALLKKKYQNLRRLDGADRELRLSDSTSRHRKSMPARTLVASAKNSELMKRGSVYQSSKEMSTRTLIDARRNVQQAFSDETFLSFDLVDTLPTTSGNKTIGFPQLKQLPLVSLDTNKDPSVAARSTEFLELSFRDLAEEPIKLRGSCSDSVPSMDSLTDTVEFGSRSKANKGKGSVEEPKFDSEHAFRKEGDGNILSERDTMGNLPKSFSAKAVMCNSACPLERETSKASPKSRFSPFKKMLDPIIKSKSLRSPALMEAEICGSTGTDPPSIKRHRVFRKSLLNDFSNAMEKMNVDDGLSERDQVSVPISSPAHLHATLKLDCEQGAPSYEFAMKSPEDILLAKTWRTDSAVNWVYTFHSCKKKSSTSNGWGSKERHGQSSPLVGQMQVSCYLCSEVSDSGSLQNSTVTEFVLYDIAQARRSFAIEEASHCPSDSAPTRKFTVGDSLVMDSPSAASYSTESEDHCRRRHPSSDFDSDPSTSYPWALADLHPYLQISAVVVQIPLNREEIKERQMGGDKNAKENRDLPSAPSTDLGSDITFECMNYANVKVVTPSGRHGMPNSEKGSPSSLLDRWRLGGGCDCGGWDMGCPIVVLDKPCFANDVARQTTRESQPQMALCVQVCCFSTE